MALRQLNSYSLVGNDDLDALMETEDKNFKGKCNASLTEYDTTAKPKLAAGSVVEVNGALFIADDDEDPSGSPADGTVYLKIVPSGSTAIVELTASAPAWDNEKQGWYSPTAGEENHRYVGGCTKTGASYTSKFLLLILNSVGLKAYKDRISFTFLDNMEIGELIIGDLKMYAYGDVPLIHVTQGQTKTFYIKKPIYCHISGADYSTTDVTFKILANGSYIGVAGLNGYLTEVGGLRFLYPGQYRIYGGAYTQDNLLIRCLSAEGINELDVDKIIEIIT